MRPLALLLGLGAALAPAAAGACYLEFQIGGFTTTDPLAIPVLVAARAAEDEGRIPGIDRRDLRRMQRAVVSLAGVPRALAGQATAAGPARFAVLQVNTGYWTRYRVDDGVARADAHQSGPADGEAVIAVADGALLELLRGAATVESLEAAGLLRARGDDARAALEAFRLLVGEAVAGPYGGALASSAALIDG